MAVGSGAWGLGLGVGCSLAAVAPPGWVGPGKSHIFAGRLAGALLSSLPVAFIYSFFVEHYVSGMTGSVKE